jgi:Uma2 family endonuclease
MSWDEFKAGKFKEGFRYELIDGRLYVSPGETFPENVVRNWLRNKLSEYRHTQPKVLDYVTGSGSVFVPGREEFTAIGPDVVAYCGFPWHRPLREIRWEDLSPVLVGEVMSAQDPDKDLVRNVELYGLVPSIKEYWILDAREDADHPSLTARRRQGKRWRVIERGPSDRYTTRLLPGFELTLNVRT